MKSFIALAVTLLLFSCHKTQDTPVSRQREIATELGFDVNKIQFTSTSTAPQLTFKTLAEAKQYFNDLKKQAVPFKINTVKGTTYRTASDTLENGTVIRVIYSTSLTQWWLWVGYNVNFSWERSGSEISTMNWNSGIVGMTLGVSWEQKSVDTYTYNGSVYFTIQGYQNYNLLVEGVGTMFTEPVTIQGVYNTATGTGSMTTN